MYLSRLTGHKGTKFLSFPLFLLSGIYVRETPYLKRIFSTLCHSVSKKYAGFQVLGNKLCYLYCSRTLSRPTIGVFFSRRTDLTIVRGRHCFVFLTKC